MFVLPKQPGRDFVILNFSDTHMKKSELGEGHLFRQIFERTVSEAIDRVKPDLITISGDISWAGDDAAHAWLADYFDSFGIPWAPVMGNHDNQCGDEFVSGVADVFLASRHCLFEKGAPSMGCGNYVIVIEEDGHPVEALFMMDSHNRYTYTDANGESHNTWGRLNDEQLAWYQEQNEQLKARGCTDTALVMHMPMYAYYTASAEAYRENIDWANLQYECQTNYPAAWKDGVSAVGVEYEGIGACCVEDGVFDVLWAGRTTKHVLVGHDHINNWFIDHHGIKLCYSLKTGPSAYWRPFLNGGTVLRVTENGISDIHHEYVDCSDLLDTWT